MLKRKITSGMLAAALIIGSVPVCFAEEVQAVDNAAVSGYVSTDSGAFTLVNETVVPKIYVDDEDYEGVIRAAGDLSGDIGKVTGKTALMVSEDIGIPLEGAEGIAIGENSMSVMFTSPIGEGDKCYVAAYNADGSLAEVKISTAAIKSGDAVTGYEFDTAIEKPENGEIKAFVWDEQMKPITEVIGMAENGDIDLSKASVIIGTVGKSEAIELLSERGKLDVSGIEGKWESFTIQQIENTLVIAGSDKRGTIYGIYDLCEKIGVSPWHFWADTVVGHADKLYINLPEGGYTEGEPSVQYRGIFLNDEFNMTEWSKYSNDGKNMGNETYERIFELLLRLKANYLWPAMHKYSTAFNATEKNAELADMYGIVMGSSHCEPVLRNNLGELYTYQQKWISENPDKKLYFNTTDENKNSVAWMWTDKDDAGNAVDNKEFLTDYWRERAKVNNGYESTYTLGMRGVHDGKFGTNMEGMTALTEIIEAQTMLIREEVAMANDKDISEVPQVFIPYKEMLDYYNKGLAIPDYVTLMWTDDNFGYIRQLPTDAERERSGGAGIYYHLSYHGRPTSYLWLGTAQPGLIREEMTKAYDLGAKKIWVANVGDLKPAETEIEYFLDLARDVEGVRNEDIGEHISENAKRDFGFDDAQAQEYADIKLGYYELANARRPEHMANGLYSLTEFGDEGQRLLDSYSELVERSETLYSGLSVDKQPSFYELLLYPLRSTYNMTKKYIASDKALYYANNGYGSAVNKYAQESDRAHQNIVDDTALYTSMLDGKWDKMMNPFQTGLRGSFGGPVSGKLTNPTVSELAYTDMVIVPEGGENIAFSMVQPRARFIDIINTGTGSFEWRASADKEWIVFNKTSGTVADNDRIYVGINSSKAPAVGSEDGVITFERMIGETVVDTKTVEVSVTSPELVIDKEKAYVEADGYVSIEAEHYTNSVKNGVYEWKTEKDFGRSGDSVKIYPNLADRVTTPNAENSAYLEYEVYFTSEGTFSVDVYRMPTINELSGASQKFGIGIDNNAPVIFSGNTKTTDGSTGGDAWGKGVLCNTDVVSGNITVSSAGWHTVRLYNQDAGIVIDKIVITTGEKKPSYYGAPESYNTTYNNTVDALPEASVDTENQTGDITALFEPSMMITDVTDTTVDIVNLNSNDLSGLLFVASYDENGNMLDSAYTEIMLEDTPSGVKITAEYTSPSTEGASEIQYMIISAAKLLEENVFDPIAPSVTLPVSDVSLMASYDNGYVYPVTSMSDYIGRESVCVIVPRDSVELDSILYIRQNTVGENTYEKIPFSSEGKFDLMLKVSGVDEGIKETFSTIKNIDTDTEATSEQLYSWDFATDQTGSGNDVPVLGGDAVYNSTYQCIRMTDTTSGNGSLTVDFDEALKAAHGEQITVTAKVAYGNLGGKHMNYDIVDSNGNSIVSSKINRYNNSTQSLTIGGVEKLTDGAYPPAILKLNGNNPAPTGTFSIWTITIDFASNKVNVKVSNDQNTTVNEYEGKLPEDTSYDIKQLVFTTNYNNSARSCYVDDISITKSKAESYTMTFVPVVSGGDTVIENAQITVSDKITGAVVTAEADGTYKLCDGIYNYVVTAEGYGAFEGVLELSPATESKTVTVPMTVE